MSVYPAALPTVRPAVRSAFDQGSGGGAASIIAGLFAQGQQGFWLPFTDFASLSQDSAGTLPYTALEQPVGRVLDRSGRGNHASQVTSSARGKVSAAVVSPPTRPYYLQLDGVDDFYTCGGAGSTTGFYYSDVIKLAAVGTLVVLFSNASLGKGYYLAVNPDGRVLLASGNGAAYTNITTTTKLVVGVSVHIEAIDDMTNLTVVINGVAKSISAPVHNVGPLTDFNLYRGTSPANYFNGQITEPIYRAGPPPSAHERGVIRAYQMQKAGMA